jgi:PAS domain S-box-containing protein
MIHPSLKTKITTLFPLATILLVALLLFAVKNNFWNIAAHYPSQKAATAPVYQQYNFYTRIIPLLLLFFLAMRYLLGKMTKTLFEELDEYREIRGNSIDMTYLRESERVHQTSNVSEKQTETMQPSAELASLALDNAGLSDSAEKELHERTKAEERLRKLSHAVMQCPISVIITDLEGNIEFTTPHVARLTGYEPEELLGRNHRVLKSGFTSNAKYKNLWDTILAGGEWHGELQNRKKNGQLYWERIHISPIRDNTGIITHFMEIKEDISDLKIMESQLRHTQKMEAVGQLTGGIAHDFNNILTAIIGYGNILMMKLPAESSLVATVKQVLAAAERGASLTQGLLACSRKQASNLTLVDLNNTIERVEKLLLNLIGDNIKLVSILAKQPLMVTADSMQMEQALITLATNVRDAMPEGGSITIRTELVDLNADLSFIQQHCPKGALCVAEHVRYRSRHG